MKAPNQKLQAAKMFFILPRLVQTFMTHGSHTKQQYFTLSNAPTHHFFTTHEALQTSH